MPFTFRVAFRYLRALRRSDRIKYSRLLILFCLLGTLAIFSADFWIIPRDRAALTEHQALLHQALIYGKYLGVLATALVTVFVELIVRFTIFTTISTFGILLGSGALITIISMMSAIVDDLRQKAVGIRAPIAVESAVGPYLTDYRNLIPKVLQVPGVIAATPILSTEMLMANSKHWTINEPVFVQGIEADSFSKVTELEKYMVSGSIDHLFYSEQVAHAPNSGSKLPGILIGKFLTQNLNLYSDTPLPVGSEVLLAGISGDIGPGGNLSTLRRFQIIGIFETGMLEYDSHHAYLPLPKLQQMLGIEDNISEIGLKLLASGSSELWIKPVTKALENDPNHSQYRIEDWKKRNHLLFGIVEVEKIMMSILLGLIILVATASIISDGLMLVAEKTSEIAMLKSMGATDGGILGIFTVFGMSVGALGVGLGVLGGIIACHLLTLFGLPLPDVYYFNKYNIVVHLKEASIISGFSLFCVLLATLYPAYKAARLRPVDGLR